MSAGGSNVLLTPGEAAAYLKVKERTFLDNYRRWGIQVHKVGRAIRVRQRELDHWLDKQAA